MKTKNKKIVLALVLAATLSQPVLSSAQPNGSNPFEEGTSVQFKDLSAEQKISLQEYLHAVKTTLENALSDAKGKSLTVANQIYSNTLTDVVKYSYENDPRSGLLLRYALNRAMELTVGVPKLQANGSVSFPVPGILSNTTNQDLVTIVLEDSIQLALKFYQDDREAAKKGTLLDLPYMNFAYQELMGIRSWLEGVNEYSLSYQVSRMALKYFLKDAANDDEVHQKYFADEILDAQQMLADFPEAVPNDQLALQGKVRVLRAKLKKLSENVQKKLASQSTVVTTSSVQSNNSGTVTQAPQGMSFVYIQPGTFTMGSNAYSNEIHPHVVTLTRGFEMQTTTVTQSQYEAVMGNNPSYFKGVNRPVEHVSWNDVQIFIQKLNKIQNPNLDCSAFEKAYSTPGCYRLPTEAEWEYAARAGTTTTYSFGDDASLMNDYAWSYFNSGSQTHDVAQLKPNAWGLYDMHGNVWQWVQDKYGAYSNSAQSDPQSLYGTSSYRVLRGGSWNGDAQDLRSALRTSDSPGYSYHHVGFRLVRTAR